MSISDISLGLKTLKVTYHNREVGTLALTVDGKVVFSYSADWLECGFSISPFSLPLEQKVFGDHRTDPGKNKKIENVNTTI